MIVREAQCRCGALRATCRSEPARVSVCHCLGCKRRSGSAFSYNAIFAGDQVETSGQSKCFGSVSDEGNWARDHFCGKCGSIVWYEIQARPNMVSVPVGAFADPSFPEPRFSVYEKRRHTCLSIETSGPIERD